MAEVEKDDLLGDIRAAYDGLEAESVEPAAPPPPAETAEQKDERVRDEQGRFAKAEEAKVPRETLTLKKSPEPGEPSPPPTATAAQPAQANAPAAPGTPAKPADEFMAPPVEWKGKAKTEWNKLPASVRAEISQDYQNLAQSREALAPVEQAIAPYRDVLIRDAGSVESGVGQLMSFYKLFLENPVGLIQDIARMRGINLGQPQGQPQGTPQAPDINSQVMQAVQQAIAPIQQRFQQTENQQIEQTVAEFAADPRYPYFQDVKVEMGRLMQAGMARNMPEAYDKAVRLNDAIRTQVEAAKAEEAKGAQAAEAEKARRAAAASLRGSPLPNGNAGGGAGSNASVLDDVRAAAAELSGS